MIDDTARLTADAWWETTAQERLMLLRCTVCSATWLPWMPHCPECGPTTEPVAIQSCGKGRLYSWVVIHHSASHPDDVPFTVGAVRLDEGSMMYGRLTAEAAAAVLPNAPLTAIYVKRHERTVVEFAPR